MTNMINLEEIVTVRVGKKGITNELLKELDNVLRARGLVKVQFLKNFRDAYGINRENKAEIAADLAQALGAKVAESRGYTILLKKVKKHG
ncbi:MAG: YhbY family RNA-binding protein [Thermofilaceae archaeon]